MASTAASADTSRDAEITAADFRRARRPEQKEQRREAILNAARELAVEQGVGAVSLGQVAARVGLAKSNVLRYFGTREEIYLQLQERELRDWRRALVARIAAAPPERDAVAAAFAAEFAARPLMCDLQANVSLVLERNVSLETVRTFKLAITGDIADIGAALAARLPAISEADGGELVGVALTHAAATWPMAHLPDDVMELLDTPDMCHAKVDFEPRMRRVVNVLLAGYLTLPGDA